MFEAEGYGPFEQDDYNEHVDGLPREEGIRGFLKSRGKDVDDAEVDRLAEEKQKLVEEVLERDGVEVYEGSVRYVDAAIEAGLFCAVVSSSANTRHVLQVAGLIDRFTAIVDGVTIKEEGLEGKPAPDTFVRAAAKLGVRSRPRRRLRGRAPPASRPAATGTSPTSSASTASTTRTTCARTARTSSCRTSTSSCDLVAPRGRHRPRAPRAAGVALHPRQRPRRRPRHARRGRAGRAERHLPLRLPRDAAAALRRVGLRQPGGGGGRRRRPRRHARPPAGRRRALRRPLRRAPRPRADAGHAGGDADAQRALALPGRPRGQGPLHPRRLLHAAGDHGHQLRGRGGRRQHARRPAVRALGGVRHLAPGLRRSPRLRADRRPAGRRGALRRRGDGPPRAPHEALRPARRRRDGPRIGRRGGRQRGRGPADRRHRPRGGRHAAAGQVRRLRLVGRPLCGLPACAGPRQPGRGAPLRLGGPARAAARVPRRVLGARGRRGRRRRRAAAGRPLRTLRHPPGQRAGGAAGDRREGPDRHRLRRPRLLGHGGLRPARALLRRPGRRGGRAALAGLDPGARPRARDDAEPQRRRVPVADDRRPRMLGLLAGRHRGLPRERGHRRRGRATRAHHR